MPFQMALDEIIFRQVEKENGVSSSSPLLRFYFSSEPWVTVGYSYREKLEGAVCRRITGGGRVNHGKDLIFSLVARKEQDKSFSSVRMSYLKIHEAVKLAFESLGIQPRFFRCDEPLPPGKDCFRFPIATDLGIEEEKIAGGAQKRSAGTLLHQESVKIPKRVEARDFISSICRGFETIFEIQIRPLHWKPELFEEAEKLARGKYCERT